ncbi:hypothetical protein [Methanocella arvoryzae]|nr:hypothetical protein [Methanocella arvoryzae]
MMRVVIINIVLALALACITQAASAEIAVPINIGIPYVVGPGFTLAAPFSQGSYIINAFNTSTQAYTGIKSLSISLAPADAGSGRGLFAVSPAISQASTETMVLDRSYFFNDYVSTA